VVRGARVHNLKNIDLEIPRDRLVVITGVSGSGKSSLAFDTLYAEGRRRYLESLGADARQLLQQVEKPDVDSIDGLSPTIAIQQKPGLATPRSTVGTITGIYDFLRLLYARVGEVSCARCGQPIRTHSIEQIVDELLALPADTRLIVLAPLATGAGPALQEMARQGFTRVMADGRIVELDGEGALEIGRASPQAKGSGRLARPISRAQTARGSRRDRRAPRRSDRQNLAADGIGRRAGDALNVQIGLRTLRHARARNHAGAGFVQQPRRRVSALQRPGRDRRRR